MIFLYYLISGTKGVNSVSKKYLGINYKLMEDKIDFLKIQKEKFFEEHALRMDLLRKEIMLKDYELKKYCDK